MNISEALQKRRSIRRFRAERLPREALARIAEAARLAPTMMNRQPLQFAVIESAALCANVFPLTMWARGIPDGSAGPDEATQPTAYVALLVDKAIAPQADIDAGAAAMAMLIEAEAQGIASCWLASIRRKELMALLGLNEERFHLHTLVALGYPAMASRAVPLRNGETVYYLEGPDSLCVPKRAAEDVIHFY